MSPRRRSLLASRPSKASAWARSDVRPRLLPFRLQALFFSACNAASKLRLPEIRATHVVSSMKRGAQIGPSVPTR